MNPTELDALRKLLGADFSEQELQDILRESPELAGAAGELNSQLRAAQGEALPELGPDFTARVMARIESPSRWWRFRTVWFTLPRLAVVSAAAFALVLGLWLGALRREASFPGLNIREALGPHQEKIYFVRFAIRDPHAKRVAVAGDFNQWNPAALDPAPDKKGLFTVELPLTEGSYSYAFVVDGKRWIADASADKVVDDGFGKRNSVINL
jgi:hypothetical protein